MHTTAGSKKNVVWTNDELGLLLSVTHQYKVQELMETVDWESVKSKYMYDDILTKQTEEEAKSIQKDYPHTNDKIEEYTY